jgi:hypothetical protein
VIESVEDRRARWTENRASTRLAIAEAQLGKQATQIEILTKQRDDAIAAGRAAAGLQPRLERQQAEVARALSAAKAAVAERDEARAAWDTLRLENEKLRKQVDALKVLAAPVKPALISDAAIAEEDALADRRAALIAEQQALQAEQAQLKELGQHLSPRAIEIKAKLADLQRSLEADAKRFKTLKTARNVEITRLEREIRRLRPYKALAVNEP